MAGAKNRRALIALFLFLPFAGRAQDAAAPEMVEVEVRFYEIEAGQMPTLMPHMGPVPDADPLQTAASGKTGQPAAPALLSVMGVFTSEQVDLWTRELKSAGAKLLDRQKIVVLSGHRARIQNARELRYPTHFDSSNTPGAEGLYPTAFETKDIGFHLELEPRIGPDGYTIDLIFSPRVVEFQGFIDATEIPRDASAKQIQELLKTPPKKGTAWQPVFRSREVSTEVTVYSGQTVLLNSPAAAETPGTMILVTTRIVPPQ